MKQRFLLFLTTGVLLAAMVFGMIKRQTYTDVLKQENYLEQMEIAELPERMADFTCSFMSQGMPKAPIILRVEVTGEIDYRMHAGRQKAVIRQIYAGEEPKIGEEIYLYSERWHFEFNREPVAISTGFVNILEVGTEYLVFADEVFEDWETGLSVVRVYDGDFVITPVFCYEERQNVVLPTSGDTTYVPYKDVRNNEFFATSEEAMQKIVQMKKQMLSLYPRGEMD